MTLLNDRGISNEINVTPLIDILLVLLIIFMVITPLTPRGLDALVPQAPTKPEPERASTVVIQVSKAAGGSVLHINGEAVDWDAFSARLTKIFATRAERVAFVTADADLDFEQVAAVIDVARTSGVDRIGLMPGRPRSTVSE